MVKDKMIKQILERKDLIDLVTNAGIAYTGYRATGHWSGGLAGVVALKLAQAQNLAAGIAGVATLAGLGISAYSDGTPNSGTPPVNPNWDPLIGAITETVAPFWAWFTDVPATPPYPYPPLPTPPPDDGRYPQPPEFMVPTPPPR